MIQENLTKKIEIEFEGVLRKASSIHPYVEYETLSDMDVDMKIANAAIQAGYNVGETFKYKIIIEPKD